MGERTVVATGINITNLFIQNLWPIQKELLIFAQLIPAASDFDGQPADALDDAADVGEDAPEVFRPHLYARALDVEYQVNVDFYQCTCHIVYRGFTPCLLSVTPSGLLLGCSFFLTGVPLRFTPACALIRPSAFYDLFPKNVFLIYTMRCQSPK